MILKSAAGMFLFMFLFVSLGCVRVHAASIKLNKTSATIYTKGTTSVQLKATVKGKSSKVTWKSSNPKAAAVNSKGKVTAKKAGKATITAKANGKTAKCKVTVRTVLSEKQAQEALRKYLKNSTYYFNSCGDKEGNYYTYFITYTSTYVKIKFFVDMRTGKAYESGHYLGVNEWKPSDPKRYVFNAYKYL